MPRPQVTMTITEEQPPAGDYASTGTALWAFYAAGVAGPGHPVVCHAAADVTASGAFTGAAGADVTKWVGDALAAGATTVVLSLAALTAPATAPSAAQWQAALDAMGEDYGPGQVAIPGVTTADAQTALAAHTDAHDYRCGIADGAKTITKTDALAIASGFSDNDSAARLITVVPWVTVSAPAGTTRDVPASVLTCGLISRNDAANGHANNSPAIDQGRGAGTIRQGLKVTAYYTDADRDALNDGGVSVIRMRQGLPTLYGFRSASTDALFKGAAAGRYTMQLAWDLPAQLEQFLERQIDGRGGLYGEVAGVLHDYFEQQFVLNALYGATSADAYAVQVATLNTANDAAAGRINSASQLKITQSAETINYNLAVLTAAGSLAA